MPDLSSLPFQQLIAAAILALWTLGFHPGTCEETVWNFHAWHIANNSKIPSTDFRLPDNESEAAQQICSHLSSLPSGSRLLALTSSNFYPGLAWLSGRANLAYVTTNAPQGIGSVLPSNWLPYGSVGLYPSDEVWSQLLVQLVDWVKWSRFAVVFETREVLRKYRLLVSQVKQPVTFRQVGSSNAELALTSLKSIKEFNINNIILDMPGDSLNFVLSLAEIANLTGVQYNFIHIGYVNTSNRYKSTIGHHLLTGVNATNVFPAPLFNLPIDSSPSMQRWELANRLINEAHAASSTTLQGAEIALDCGIKRPASAGLQSLILQSATDRLGQIDQLGIQQPAFNFSFQLSHLYAEEMLPFANWSLTGGFRQDPNATARHRSLQQAFVLGRNLSVVTIELPPFVMYRTHDAKGNALHGNDRWYGHSIDLLARICELNGMRYSIHRSFDGNFGVIVNSSGAVEQWNGMIFELMNGLADVAVGPLAVTYERERVVDFTAPYMSFGLSVIMKQAVDTTELFQFLNPFHRDVWLFTLLALAVSTLCIFAVARLSPYEWFARSPCSPAVDNAWSFHNSLWFAASSLLQQGCELGPSALSTRIAGAAWWLFILVLISSYTANLAAFLTVKKLNDVSTLAQLAAQDRIKYGLSPSGATFSFFTSTPETTYQTMYNQMKEWNATGQSTYSSLSQGIERVRGGGFAFIMESPVNLYYRERDPECSLIQVGEIFNPGTYGFAVAQGNTILRETMSESILKLLKEQYMEGLLMTWLKQFNTTGDPCSQRPDSTATASTGTLSIDAFKGLFLTLGCGLILSLLVLLGEIVYKLFMMRRSEVPSHAHLASFARRAISGQDERSEAYAMNGHAPSGSITNTADSVTGSQADEKPTRRTARTTVI